MLIDRDHETSVRETFRLETTGDRARLTITRERNALARLDAWSEPWQLESREVFVGTVAPSGAYELAAGPRKLQLWCRPRSYDVRPATARLRASAGDCRDVRGTWEPATTERVAGISCAHVEDGVDATPLDLTAAPGIEWVDERNGCLAYGQGYRWMTSIGAR